SRGSSRSVARKRARVERKGALAYPDSGLLALFGVAPCLSGIAVTPETAMTCAPVACAVETIATTIGSLCCDVYRETATGCEPEPTHPVQQLVSREANGWTPSALFIEQMVRDFSLHGDSVSLVNRVDSRPHELLRLDPRHVVPRLGDYLEPQFYY